MASPDPNSGDPIVDYGQTQRIVLLIDLNPLLHLENRSQFLSPLLAAVKTLLSFAPLASSLFAVRLFFSSLSPIGSAAKLAAAPSSLSLSFHLPNPTFVSLSETLNSLSFDPPALTPPRASCVAAAMRQLVHDYAWDPVIPNCESLRSNLVVLFSPIFGSVKFLSEFFNLGSINDESLDNVNMFCERFSGFFGNVNEAFVSRDIHFSWVDVRFGLECGEGNVDGDRLRCGFFESGVRSLGWGFCSTDSIVLGSAVVPFGLIYPEIGVSSRLFGCSGFRRKVGSQMSLEITDVCGDPLECKLFDLELVDLKMLPRNRADDALFSLEAANCQANGSKLKRNFWGSVGNGVTNIQVKGLKKDCEFVKFKGQLSDPILVCGVSGKSGKDGKEVCDGFYVSKVLEMLSVELGESVPSKFAPAWQILLSYLYREGCWALVTVSSDSGVSHTGILKPLTVSSALLFILDEGFYIGAVNVDQSSLKVKNELCKPDVDLNHLSGSQTGPSSSKKHSAEKFGKKKTKRNSPSLQDLTWSTFCKAAFEYSDLHLEEVYFTRQSKSSKKLKFLKCWMKQIKKVQYLIMEKKLKAHQDNQKEVDNRLDALHQESEQPLSSSGSVGENSLTVASGIQDEAAQEYRLESSEAFFSNLPTKIRQGIESEAVDLGTLAYRLVSSSTYWLNQKQDKTTPTKTQSPLVKSQNIDDLVAAELLKLLLRDPKDMVAPQKSHVPSSQASYPGAEGSVSQEIVREYELQIFFRMEILQSEVGASIRDSVKQKFVKHICMLLETIRVHFHRAGGFFGDWTLENYVGKIIKSRYCQTLEDVIHKIYTKMDLLLLDDEEELPINFFNSEDNSQSYKEKPVRDEMGEDNRMRESASAEYESKDLPTHKNGRPSAQVVEQEEHARKLAEAQQRRERAWKRASFRLADLQRVCAPKQPKASKPKSHSLPKPSKRKDRTGSCFETVLETPSSENKRIHFEDENYRDNGNKPCAASKSLFQDEDE